MDSTPPPAAEQAALQVVRAVQDFYAGCLTQLIPVVQAATRMAAGILDPGYAASPSGQDGRAPRIPRVRSERGDPCGDPPLRGPG